VIDHRRLKLYGLGRGLTYVGTTMIPAVLLLVQVERSDFSFDSETLENFTAAVSHYQLLLLAIGFALERFGAIFTRQGQPTILRGVQTLLDSVHRKAFLDAPAVPENFCRVTLFRWTRWSFRGFWDARSQFFNKKRKGPLKWPWSGWVVPFMRSGQLRGKSSAVFFAPKSDCDWAEGMAGRAWAQAGTKTIFGLKEMTATSAPGAIRRYAVSTHTPVYMIEKYVKSGRALPRSMTAYQVCANDGAPWGSIVIDSREAEAVNEEAAYAAIDTISSSLTALLEGLE
jgi:hypothetical protein